MVQIADGGTGGSVVGSPMRCGQYAFTALVVKWVASATVNPAFSDDTLRMTSAWE